ncbi:hypothetical protein OUZ56_008016 [Daphnia magna]|uniref:Uncharacterized protein n=1 Tax=Daphnia magna TaxID=35525 RepID=A0ABR0AC48_9CRUS|nr:hypothetical protein OUZ56_008016 [Daphnia magna]
MKQEFLKIRPVTGLTRRVSRKMKNEETSLADWDTIDKVSDILAVSHTTVYETEVALLEFSTSPEIEL